MFDAFGIGPFLIWTHVVFLLLGVFLATEFFLRLAQSVNLPLVHFQDHWWWYLLSFLGGGRIAAVIADYRVYVRHPVRLLVFWDGGYSFLGGAVGIACVLAWMTRQSRATFLQWLDVLLPATSFGLAFDWLGRFAAGQSYGKPTDVLWGITYDAMNVRYVVPIHPVQIYYALFFLFLTFVLLIVRKCSRRAGAETLFGVIFSSIAVFLFEYFRGDFGIPIFATKFDFLMLILLFSSLILFAVIELRLSQRIVVVYSVGIGIFSLAYLFLRSFLSLPIFELRFSQFLAVLALLSTIVYVVVHRRKYPHL